MKNPIHLLPVLINRKRIVLYVSSCILLFLLSASTPDYYLPYVVFDKHLPDTPYLGGDNRAFDLVLSKSHYQPGNLLTYHLTTGKRVYVESVSQSNTCTIYTVRVYALSPHNRIPRGSCRPGIEWFKIPYEPIQ